MRGYGVYIPGLIYTIPGEILADSVDSDELCHETAHMQSDGPQQYGRHQFAKRLQTVRFFHLNHQKSDLRVTFVLKILHFAKR